MSALGEHLRGLDLVATLLIIGGVILIAVAIAVHQRLTGKKVLDFKWDKLGVALTGDAFAVIILIGFAFCYLGTDYHMKGWESKNAQLKQDLDETHLKLKQVELFRDELAERLRTYRVRAQLAFPEPLNPDNTSVKVNVHSASGHVTEFPQGDGELQYGRSNLEQIILHFRGLKNDDVVQVLADCDGKKWRGRHVVTNAEVVMKPSESKEAMK